MIKRKLIVPKKKSISINYGESKIYTINNSIYKEFKDNISLATRRRKKERLKYLEQFEYLKQYYPEIEYFIEYFIGWYIKGYIMKEVKTKRLNSSSINYKDKINLLIQIREILALFKNIGLMYYDIHLGNICCNQNNLPIFFDIDSILQIDEKIPDINPQGFAYYEGYGGQLDDKFQRIKFNILVKDILLSHKEITYDKIGQEMINYQLNIYSPKSLFANEELLEHILKK